MSSTDNRLVTLMIWRSNNKLPILANYVRTKNNKAKASEPVDIAVQQPSTWSGSVPVEKVKDVIWSKLQSSLWFLDGLLARKTLITSLIRV